MRTLAFDGRMGASGDMILGALIAAGADPGVLEPVTTELPVEYDIDTATRCGIAGTSVTVRYRGDDGAIADVDSSDNETGNKETDQNDQSYEQDHSHDGHDYSHHGHNYSHDEAGHSHGEADHSHDEDHSHEGDHSHDDISNTHNHAEGSGPHRTFPEVISIVDSLDIPAEAKDEAIAIFTLLGEAEASIHGTSLEETHFHEVGADDAIADIVGASLLIHNLDLDTIVTTPLATGTGEVEMSHGVYPIPAPAVVELASRANWSLRGGPIESELLTPTGAAILAHFADGRETLPTLEISHSGYGVGTKSFEKYPNVLRALVGESIGSLRQDTITVLETNVDDVTPEVLGGLQETLFEAGARDVSIVPLTMKKSRPGHLIKVIVKPGDAEHVARTLAEETGTLGIREHGAGHRFIADRDRRSVEIEVDGSLYKVAVKVARFSDGEIYDISCEFDDAEAVAAETSLPIRAIQERAEGVARERHE